MHWCIDETLALLSVLPFVGMFIRTYNSKIHDWFHRARAVPPNVAPPLKNMPNASYQSPGATPATRRSAHVHHGLPAQFRGEPNK